MESDCLHIYIDYLGSSGIILSSEEKAALQTSLIILQNENKFYRVYFWGKILGVKDNYFIAQGVYKDEFAGRRTFYSKDCIHWGLLPHATLEMKTKSKLAKGRFTGDPSYEFEHVETRKIGDGEEATEEEETTIIKEEERLSSVIAEIDDDVRIIPRGAFIQVPTAEVVKNRSFEGLSVQESAKLCNYMHFREAKRLDLKSLLQRANMDKAIDFMDSIEDDVPRGSWTMQFERGSGLLILRSLQWPGYVFYHVPASQKYGSCYFGTGEKNMDLPFML
ncbi:radial spoke head protein 9 [Biomphalaria glabrata]|uniref:Radial spoke head protein 9 homolog n=2 Tax=Biomphalaria TaxID=6525 RepID=A0A2C9JVN0_BIOGL|nr:radial spoke head protein 9 homolog [Biomphalaria glabrata]KAI8740662.1 putative radial spoke head protein 9 [Biomphalaria glabrata]KAI8785253.1 radial spoke head protein 9 [Biomphalaria glabrata]KAK0046941.1 radial spoke head protein 9 [Biomphalaria pfeifferi]